MWILTFTFLLSEILLPFANVDKMTEVGMGDFGQKSNPDYFLRDFDFLLQFFVVKDEKQMRWG